MSNKALGWAFESSPYEGKQLLIHIAIADVVNTDLGNEFWMSNENLARKARCTREFVNRTLKQMVEDGYLKVLGEGKTMGQGKKTVCYEFLFPNVISSELNVISSDVNVISNGENPDLNVIPGHINPSNTNPKGTQENLSLEAPETRQDWAVVWDAYLATLGRCGFQAKKLTDSRRDLIKRRLKDWSVEDLVKAVEGLEHSPFHRGDNDQRKAYNAIELILRDAQKIENFMGYHDVKPKTTVADRKHVNQGWGDQVSTIRRGKEITDDDDPF